MGCSKDATLENFKQVFLENNTMLDRAEAHHNSLSTCKTKGKVPTKMKINIQPNVMDKDNNSFQRKWKDTLQECEQKLLSLLLEHLDEIMTNTRTEIREESERCLRQLKASVTPSEAKTTLEKLLLEANKARLQRKDDAIK